MSLKELLLIAPDNALDESMKPLIKKWDGEPKSIQILEVLDKCIYSSLASGFTISVLESMLDNAMMNENITLDDLTPLAVWRNI